MSDDPMILVDGQRRDALSVLDRGLMYGDGVFRTIRLRDGQAVWWPEQYAKLAADAARLGIPCPRREVWEGDLDELAPAGEGVLKLLLTRGTGARGYRPSNQTQPTRIATVSPPPAYPEELIQQGANVRFCELRLGLQPRLAGIKHLNRLENVLARAEWDDPAIHEGLLLDIEGRVISGVSSNLFVVRTGALQTPRLHRCGVAGVARSRVMAVAAKQGVSVQEADLCLDDLLSADEVLLTNSLIGVWRVARLDERVWSEAVMHATVREWLHG